MGKTNKSIFLRKMLRKEQQTTGIVELRVKILNFLCFC